MLRSTGIVKSEPSAELDRLANELIGAAIEVHRVLGPAFREQVYEEALCIELQRRRIPFARQVPVPISYKNHLVGEGRLDLLIADQLVVELKTVEALLPVHHTQLLSYLKATGYKLGSLINFNVPILRHAIKRVILNPRSTPPPAEIHT